MIKESAVTLDPYVVLGVPRTATDQAIKQAYRRLALDSHPDRNARDPGAAERFRHATQAYALLRDPRRRGIYDATGRWDDSVWGPPDLDLQLAEALELFARDFGAALEVPVADDRAPAHSGRVSIPVEVTYDDVENGARKRMLAPCATCAGSGAREGSTQVRCTACGGSGRIRHVETALLGPRIHSERCDDCNGSGRRPLLPCLACDGAGIVPGATTVDVLIPRGTADGDALIGINANGTRFVARMVEDARWAREGADIYATCRIPYEMAVLGGYFEVPLPGRVHRLEVAPGSPSGHRHRVSGQGLPSRDGGSRGDLVVTLHIAVPTAVGALERWLLRSRLHRSATEHPRAFGSGIAGLQARSAATAMDWWSRWRAHHHQSSLHRIEKAATSLRSTARLLSESEQRLGPLLERGFRMIAPEAAVSRERLDADRLRGRSDALAEFAMTAPLLLALVAVVWLGAAYTIPTLVSAGGDAGTLNLLARASPALVALLPLLAGLASGFTRVRSERDLVQGIAAFPIGAGLGVSAMAAGATVFAIGIRLGPGDDGGVNLALGLTLGIAAAVLHAILFMLADSVVASLRAVVDEVSDHADRKVLRRYDVVANRLATQLEATERAFRQLLSAADDARRPLTSLLTSASSSLAVDRERLPRLPSFRAAAALVGAVAIVVLWIATTTVSTITAFTLFAAPALWARIAVAAAAAALCAIGILLPRFLSGNRLRVLATGIASLLAAASLVGIFTSDLTSGLGVDPGWLVAVGATAGLALSFRLPEALNATTIGLTIVAYGFVSVLLWPLAFVHAAARGAAPEATRSETPRRNQHRVIR